jgi:hypothetical protein
MPIVIANPVLPQTFFDDFESYTLLQTLYLENTDYDSHPLQGSQSWTINTKNASQMLKITGSSNPTGLVTYNALPFANGRQRAKMIHSSDGIVDTSQQFGFVARYQDNNNFIYVEMDNTGNLLKIRERVISYSTISSVAFSPALDTDYYLEFIVNGATATATVYSDSGYTTVLATTSGTVAYTGSGEGGFYASNDTSVSYVDDYEILEL